jgi:hypothetical protein
MCHILFLELDIEVWSTISLWYTDIKVQNFNFKGWQQSRCLKLILGSYSNFLKLRCCMRAGSSSIQVTRSESSSKSLICHRAGGSQHPAASEPMWDPSNQATCRDHGMTEQIPARRRHLNLKNPICLKSLSSSVSSRSISN